ncbi:MAG: PQQ-binding-like beta-propeller repeat protein [Deltaproteobacteria bacterium]|nr:MAG: PQQ-binding-like beta-propeller repeat protein [Deltaproteobacteria bacterium]
MAITSKNRRTVSIVQTGRTFWRLVIMSTLCLALFLVCFGGVAEASRIRVYIEPVEARDAGAQWRMRNVTSGGSWSAWLNSGDHRNVRGDRTYEIEFKDISAGSPCSRPANVTFDGWWVGTRTLTQVAGPDAGTYTCVSHTITSSAGAGGSIAPFGAVAVADGGDQTFTITPDGGYRVLDVTVDGASVGVVTSYPFTGVIGDHTIHADFESTPTYTISVTANAGGSFSPPSPITVSEGDNQSITITADSGYHIQDVAVDGSSVGAISPVSFTNVTANHTVTITFEANASYTITATAGANGSISPEGSVTVLEGEEPTFSIAANLGYEISDVTVDGVSQGAISTYTFPPVTADGHTISATFSVSVAPPASCLDVADSPLSTQLRAAPANIMFVLDDSGSMDWEMMVDEADGTYHYSNNEYVYVFDMSDNVYTSYDTLDSTTKAHWKPQCSTYNKVYYNPKVTYQPWPLKSDATPTAARSNPNNASPTLDLTAEYYSISNSIVIDERDAEFTEVGSWSEGVDQLWEAYPEPDNGQHYRVTTGTCTTQTATWTPSLTAGDYEVRAWWRDDSGYSTAAPFTINHSGGSTTVTKDQTNYDSQWNSLGNFHFDGISGDVTLSCDPGDSSKEVCADAVEFVPADAVISIKNAHYFTWHDANTNDAVDSGEVYLINIDSDDSEIEYWQWDGNGTSVTESGTSFTRIMSPPTAIIPKNEDWTNRTYQQELQNFANWFSYYRRRELTTKAAVANVIDEMQGVQVGFLSIHDRLKQTVLKVKIQEGATLEDNTSTLLTSMYANYNSNSGTPLRNALDNVGEYYHQNDGRTGGLGSSPYASAADGGECQQAFAIAMTDGFYNGSSPGVGNQDNGLGDPYEDNYSDTLADVAMKYYKNDLSSGLDDLVPTNFYDQATYQHMVTYGVSFGVTGNLNPDDYDLFHSNPAQRVYPTWPNPSNGDQQKIDDLWHASVNGRGSFLSASDPQELIDSLLGVLQNIESRVVSDASVSINGEELHAGTTMFQSSYSADGWTGDVKAYGVDQVTGEVLRDTYVWSAAEQLDGIDWDTGREIATYTGTAGIPFRWANLDNSPIVRHPTLGLIGQQDALNNDPTVLDYIRGDHSLEAHGDPGGSFRDRISELGDIIHSAPLYEDGVLYVGGNDGMLHAFDATTGLQLFAYVPNLVFPQLIDLVDTSYTHKFYADLTPFAKRISSSLSMLVGGLGKGGRGYYALDITNPASNTESNAASWVKWEFPRFDTDGADINDLGYSYSKAFIVRSNDASVDSGTSTEGWVVIFGNGYNSTTGNAVLFILKASDGSVVKKLDVGVGGCNGLSTPVLIDVDNDHKVDYVYAGDLQGNMWKFDLTDSSKNNWEVAYKDGATPKPLFQAKDANGNPQAITTKPDVMRHCEKHGYLVVFGTGKYLGTTDFSNNGTHTIYGIWDYGDDSDDREYLGSFDRSSTPQLSNQPDTVKLLAQSEVDWREVSGHNLRTLSDNEPDWGTISDNVDTHADSNQNQSESEHPNPGIDPADTETTEVHAGWYFDLPLNQGGPRHERVIGDLMIRDGNLIVTSFAPADSACSAGGSSVIHELNPCSGSRLDKPHLDINGDGTIDDNDLINIGTPEDPVWVAPSGLERQGKLYPPVILRMPGGREEMKYFSTTTGTIEMVKEKAERRGLYYWRAFQD